MVEKILEAIDTPPSTNLMMVLANSGYTIEASVADIVDNSISHNAKNIEVNFVRSGLESTVEIIDDGDGMNDDVLRNAMTYAHVAMDETRAVEDLGRYGVGMKAASSSFCKKLQVISKGSEGTVNSYELPFGEKEWKTFKIATSPDDISTKTGTRIIWHELKFTNDEAKNEWILLHDADAFVNTIDRVSTHLSKVFGLIILEKGIKFRVNGTLLEGWSPFAIPGQDVSSVYEDSSFSISGQKVHVKAFLLPVADHLDQKQLDYATCKASGRLTDFEGFYVYRSNRLIVSGGWLGIPGLGVGEKFNYARIGVWFEPSAEADKYLRVNFLKDSLVIPNDFASYLIKSAKIARNRSSNSYDYKKNPRPYKRKHKDENVPIWDVTRKEHSSIFSINENHPLIQKYTEGADKRKIKALFNLLAKEFPYQELENSTPQVASFTDQELEGMLKDEFVAKMKEPNAELTTVVRAIMKEKPFCDDNYNKKCAVALSNLMEEYKNG